MKPSAEVVANARKSLVVVSTTTDDTKSTYYCGFIVARARSFQGKTYTMTIAPSPFAIGEDDGFSVCFFDGRRSKASLIAEDMYFCLLATAIHKSCVEFSPSDVAIIYSPTFMLAPTSPTRTIPVATHITLPSLESYALDDVERKVQDSEKFFLVSCADYFQSTPDGTDRLSGGLVYNMSGIALGAVVQVVVGATYLRELLERLLPEVPIITPKKEGGRKRKRKRGKHARSA